MSDPFKLLYDIIKEQCCVSDDGSAIDRPFIKTPGNKRSYMFDNEKGEWVPIHTHSEEDTEENDDGD